MWSEYKDLHILTYPDLISWAVSQVATYCISSDKTCVWVHSNLWPDLGRANSLVLRNTLKLNNEQLISSTLGILFIVWFYDYFKEKLLILLFSRITFNWRSKIYAIILELLRIYFIIFAIMVLKYDIKGLQLYS